MSVPSNHNERYKQSPDTNEVSPLAYIDALRVAYSKKTEILSQLDSIADRLSQVSPVVQAHVSEILRAQLSLIQSGNTITTATILAINPRNTVQKAANTAANDEKYQIAA